MESTLFSSDSEYKKHFTNFIVKPLKPHGFIRYKTVHLVRKTPDGFLQILNFQKEAHGEERFTVNVATIPLFIEHKYLTLSPGTRLGYFKHGTDKWWSYDSQETITPSFLEVQQLLMEEVLPALDDLQDSESLLEEYANKRYPIEFPADEGWAWHLLGYLNLRTGNLSEAAKRFDQVATLQSDNDRFDWVKRRKAECEALIGIIREQPAAIPDRLQQNIELSKANLGIPV